MQMESYFFMRICCGNQIIETFGIISRTIFYLIAMIYEPIVNKVFLADIVDSIVNRMRPTEVFDLCIKIPIVIIYIE